MITSRPATMASLEGAVPDLARLRTERRRRMFAAMAAADLDAVVLGRPANVAYASGARQLWTSGARPFAPSCVVIGATQRVHVLSTWDEGIPSDIAHDELYGLSWNPANLTASLGRIPGLASATRVGTDSSTAAFPLMLGAVAPGAALVDSRGAMWAARTTKTPDEVACIVTATAIAEAALTAMVATVRPGVTEREILGVYAESIATAGAPTPPTEGVVSVMARRGRTHLRRIASDRPIESDDVVVLDAGAMFAGYEGGVGRTAIVDASMPPGGSAVDELAARCRARLDAVVDACRVGARGGDVREAWLRTGEPSTPEPLVQGVGLGMEPPVIDAAIGDDAVLQAGMVLSVSSWVIGDGAGGCFQRETVLVGADGAEVLSRFAPNPVVRSPLD